MPEEIADAFSAGITLHAFSEVASVGAASPAPHTPPKGDDLAFICYT